MDCLTAQGLISDAVDRETVDGPQLAEAKQHCLGCETCSLFVRTLLIARNAPTPTPPADLADRVMLAIRAEHERALAADAASAAASASATAPASLGSELESHLGSTSLDADLRPGPAEQRVSLVAAVREWILSMSLQERLTWASATVVIFAAVGMGTVMGVRVLVAPPLTPKTTMVTATDQGASAAQSYGTAVPESAGASATAPAAITAPVDSYVTIQGVVFALNGPSTVATEGLKPAGETLTALGTGGSPVAHSVYSADDPDRAYVADGPQLFAFDRVKRTFGGSNYQLTSADLTAYGQWPTLPPTITQPTAADGSPTFVTLQIDVTGARIYRLSTADAQTGIGVAPGTTASDPAAGNPNWTWWTRIP